MTKRSLRDSPPTVNVHAKPPADSIRRRWVNYRDTFDLDIKSQESCSDGRTGGLRSAEVSSVNLVHLSEILGRQA
jgi:hypothetical protein